MYQFLLDNRDLVINFVLLFLAAVSFIVTVVRTGSIKKSIKCFEEVYNLKYKTQSTPREKYSQGFSPEVKDYILNPATNELEEKPIPKNVQDFIQSHIETCLERMLERFLPNNVQDDDLCADYTERVDDLAVIGEAMERAEYYRDKLGLSDSASIADIYSAVDKSAQSLKSKLGEAKPYVGVEKPKEDNNA